MENYTTFPNQCKNSTNNGNSATEKFGPSFWIDGVLISVIAAMGVILNIIALFILVSKKNMQNVFNHLLVFSFIAHNLYLFTSAFPRLYYNFKVEFAVLFIPHFAYPIEDIALTLNVLITVCLSHERYIVIPNPTQYKRTMNVKKNRHRRLLIYILPIIIFSFIYNIPKFLSYNLVFNTCKNKTEKEKTDLRKNEHFITYYLGMSWLVFTGISFLLLCLLNWKILRNIKKNFSTSPEKLTVRTKIVMGRRFSAVTIKKQGQNAGKITLRKDEQLSLASVAIVIVFLVCNLPRVTDEIMDAFDKEDYKLEVASRLFLTINSSLNIIIYCSLNRRFNCHFTQAMKTLIYRFTFSCFGQDAEHNNKRIDLDTETKSEHTTQNTSRISTT